MFHASLLVCAVAGNLFVFKSMTLYSGVSKVMQYNMYMV